MAVAGWSDPARREPRISTAGIRIRHLRTFLH